MGRGLTSAVKISGGFLTALSIARSNTRDAVGIGVAVAEDEFIEVGLQMLRAEGAGGRAEQPALQQRDRPNATRSGRS